LPAADLLARARAAGLCRMTVTFDVTGLAHPRDQAEAEFQTYQRARQAEAPPAADPVTLEWQAERRRDLERQQLVQQLYEVRTAAQGARDEAARLLAGGDEAAAAESEQAAAATKLVVPPFPVFTVPLCLCG
jgi:hypothetical protein